DMGDSDRALADLDAARPLLLASMFRGTLDLQVALVLRARIAEADDPARAALLLGCVEANKRDWVLPFGVNADYEALRERVVGAHPEAHAAGQALALTDAW
ncbi:MAG: hypothetical protein QOK42_697, partial [Frankiaceae bacterium]|nr:hypothetical protein [Frankiaceae bacterium]